MALSSIVSPILLQLMVVLGQEEGAAPPPGGGGSGSPLSTMLFPLILIGVVFWFLIIGPERRKQKARTAMIGNVKKGDQVVTTGGMLGKVMKVEDREVLVQIDRDNDVRVRFQKHALQEVISGGSAPAGSESSPAVSDGKKK